MATDATPVRLKGVPASSGTAGGPAWVRAPRAEPAGAGLTPAIEPEREAARFALALAGARRELAAQQAAASGDPADVLAAHLLMLDDPLLAEATRDRILAEAIPAEQALSATVAEVAASLRALDDEYIRARAEDVEDVGGRIARRLADADPGDPLTPPAGAVLIAAELAPSELLAASQAGVVAFALEAGAVNSHVSILARSLGLPGVVGVAGLLASVTPGVQVTVVGATGEVAIGGRTPASGARAAVTPAGAPAVGVPAEARTADGRRIRLYANVGRVEELALAPAAGAEGVGVLRTEFLFLSEPPSEEHQYEVYRTLAERLGGRPLVIRTLDAGGDKPLPYLPMPHEENPYLGLRGLRLSLTHPEVFRTQLRAILRAAVHGQVAVMYPMVTNASELVAAAELLRLAASELEERGQPAGPVEAGAMVEVPAAALCAGSLAREAAFLSVGTNDLTQYALAADRNNASVAYLYSQTHPAVLRLLQATVEGAHEWGRPVAVCGEVAGDVAALPLLVGLGVDELSVLPAAVGRVRAALAGLDSAECVGRLAEALRG